MGHPLTSDARDAGLLTAEALQGQQAATAVGAARNTRQVAEALTWVNGDPTTPQQKGHLFEVKDRDADNAWDRLLNRGGNQRVLNDSPNGKAIDGRDLGTGRAVQHKKANMHTDSSQQARRRGARSTNRQVQEKAIRDLDSGGESGGVVITTKNDNATTSSRVEESRVSRNDLDKAVDDYQRAASGISASEASKAALTGAAIGAGLGAGLSALTQARGVIGGDIDVADAAVEVAKGEGIGAAAGATGKVASAVAESVIGVAPTMGKVLASGGVVAGVMGVVASGIAHTVAVVNGDERPLEAVAEVGKDSVAVAVGGVAAAAVGLVLVPFELPVFLVGGVTIGASVGVSWAARRSWRVASIAVTRWRARTSSVECQPVAVADANVDDIEGNFSEAAA